MNRGAAKISALSSGETEKYEYLAREEILPSDQDRIKEQTTFTHSPLGKAFGNQIKAIEDQREKQINTLGKDGKQLVKSSSQKQYLTLLKQKKEQKKEKLANEM